MVEMTSIIYFLNEMMKHIETYFRVLNNIQTDLDRLNKGSTKNILNFYIISKFLISNLGHVNGQHKVGCAFQIVISSGSGSTALYVGNLCNQDSESRIPRACES